MPAFSLLRHTFPPPQFITFPNVGVDISDTSLKYVRFERKRPRDTFLQLDKWGSVDIPDGVVERGNVHDVAKLTEALKTVSGCCGTEYVRVSLPEERAYLFETTIASGTAFKEIRGLLEFKLEENVPLSPRDAYFNYDIVEDTSDESTLRVVVAVYAKDTINNYLEACTGAGLIPLSFEIEAESIARSSILNGNDKTHMLIDFGRNRMGVGIVHKGALMYTSTIDVGGKELSKALRSVLGDVEEDTLTHIKNTKGIQNTKVNAEVYGALAETMDIIKEELQTRIHYWDTRDVGENKRMIEKIILCGGSSNLLGLPEFLTDTLGIQTERAQIWQNAFSLESFIPPITQRKSLGYATAVGLALHDFMYGTV